MLDNMGASSEEWNKQLQKDASASAFQFLMRLVKTGWEWAETADRWQAAAELYVQRWIDRWGQIKPLGADHPIPLHQIFVQVRAVPRSFVKRFASIETMQAEAQDSGNRSFFGLNGHERRKSVPRSGMAIANEHARLNLLGAPGSGKSTFIRRLGLEALLPRADAKRAGDNWAYRSKYVHQMLPVLIELRSLRRNPCSTPEDLVSLLVEEFANAGFPASRKFVDAALNDGSLLILLDGVDEIPSGDLSLAITAIRDFIDLYPKCRYVLSCRTAFYCDWFTGFHDFVLADFDHEQVAEFARNWFQRREEMEAKAADMFLRLLSSPMQRATRELAGSPLLLTFLCLVFRRTQEFPRNRAQLYQEALGIYLKEWNASKFVHNDPIYKDLSPEMELGMLKDIAGPAFIENRYFFTGEELTSAIHRFLMDELNAPKSLSPGQILDAIAIQQGLFIERATNVWTFSHLTIQEYLAAAWLVEEGRITETVVAHSGDNRWREIFLLMAGLTRADGLLKHMMDEAEVAALTITEFLAFLTQAADEDLARLMATPSAQALSKIGMEECRLLLRSCYFGSIHETSSLSEAVFNAVGLERRVLSRTSEGGVVSIATITETKFALEFDLKQCALCAQVSKQIDVRALESYSSLCTLVCDCKQAALRVSREGWDAIVARILSPPSSAQPLEVE